MGQENPYFGFRKDRAKTYSLWERFNAGLIDPEGLADPYERLLIDEWRHCANLGIDVAKKVGVRLSDEEFRSLLEDSQELFDTARPVIDRVSTCLMDVPGILILADSTGTILHVAGDSSVREVAAERSGIVEGSRWLESVAGTNGLGSAIRKRDSVHVYSAEHYCEGWHAWTCAATPIFGPDGSDLLGVIDFTTIDKDYRDQALALSCSLANAIQADLRLAFQLERSFLLQKFQEFASRYPTESLAVCDRRGKPVRFSPTTEARKFAEQNAIQRMAEGVRHEEVTVVLPGTDRRIGSIHIVGSGPKSHAGRSREDELPLAKGDFVTADTAMARVLAFVEKVAASSANVLILGETGTGKELIARYIHGRSCRARGTYVPVNCAAVSRELMASSFFGYVGGAFTGADPKGRKGYFEAANDGTLFLDEVGELPPEMQAGLLRVLEDATYQRVGSDRTNITECRVIAATNRDLQADIANGAFRSDLYYRLNVIRVTIPPLRERPTDILLLARRFVERLCARNGSAPLGIATDVEARLLAYSWPGNVRELRNVIEAAVICAEGEISLDDLPPDIAAHGSSNAESTGPKTGIHQGGATGAVAEELRDYERKVILAALDKYRKVNRVARELGISRSTLYRKFDVLGIDQRQYR